MTADERALEPWFAAARAEPADPPLALLSAILADAGGVAAERATATEAVTAGPEAAGAAAPEAAAQQPRQAGRRRMVLDGLGGWKGLTALAACAAIGFWIGIAGQVTIEDGAVWSGARAVASDATPEDPVGAFFDLASLEG